MADSKLAGKSVGAVRDGSVCFLGMPHLSEQDLNRFFVSVSADRLQRFLKRF
jgi:hypothetical protein